MDENQFRILIRMLEQMQRTLARFIEVIEERDNETRRRIHDLGATVTYLREQSNNAPDGPAHSRGGPL